MPTEVVKAATMKSGGSTVVPVATGAVALEVRPPPEEKRKSADESTGPAFSGKAAAGTGTSC